MEKLKERVRVKRAAGLVIMAAFLAGGIWRLDTGGGIERIQEGITEVFGERKLADPRGRPTARDDLVRLLSEAGIEIRFEPKLMGDGFEARLESGEKVIFNPNDFENNVAALQIMLKRFKMDNKKAFLIDFRFGKPVVRFKGEE